MNGSRNPYRSESGLSQRAIFALVLCVLIPPVGLLYIWRLSVFRTRGRAVVSALACVVMIIMFSTGLFGLMDWSSMPPTVAPVPGAAVAVTAHPDDETLNALSNIDDIIAMDMGSDEAATISPDATPMLTQEEQQAQQQEVLNTTVYAVHRGAKYYHVSTVCGNQSNGRALTVAEAIAEGMGACPNCDPPVP